MSVQRHDVEQVGGAPFFVLRRAVHAAQRIDIRIWASLFAALLGFFLWRGRADVRDAARSLRAADPVWLAAVAVASLGIQLLFAFKLTQLLALFGHRARLLSTAEAQLERHAIATVVPAGGAPGALVLLRRLTRTGIPERDAVLAFLLFGVLGHASFALVLVPTVVWLALGRAASAAIFAGTAGLTAIGLGSLGLVAALLRGWAPPNGLRRRLPGRVAAFVSAARTHRIRRGALVRPLTSAIAVDLAGIAMLDASLRAVGFAPPFGTAAAGYCVGTLFLMLAPVFQGIGLVEVTMVVALQRLGVPAGAAVSATLVYRVGELWLPLAIGVALQVRRQPSLRSAPASLPALFTAFTGLMSVLSVMAPHHIPARFDRAEGYSLIEPRELSRTLALMSGFGLLLLSYGLWRRRRVAWVCATGLAATVALSHIGFRHHRGVANLALVDLALLLVYHRRFRVRSDVPTMRRGLAGVALSLVVALAYGTAGFWLLDRREFGTEFSLTSAVTHTLRLYFSLGTAGLHPRTRYADWFLDSFTIIGVAALAAAALSVLRPVVWRRHTLPQEREAARDLVARYGDSSLDAFKATPDKRYFFSPQRDAVIAFGISGGTAIALGDPVAADDAARREVLAGFLDFVDANGWSAAFHQVPALHLPIYRAAGLSALKIGEEAIVDVEAFSLSGHAMKGLRGAVNRMTRDGFAVGFYDPPLSDAVLAELRAVSDEWLRLPGRRERDFTLGQWNDEEVRGCPVATVERQDLGIVAFVNLIPDGVPGEATFDLMRHRAGAPSGCMDLLFVRLIERLRGQGYRRLSLGMAPWSDVGTSPDAPLIERGVGVLTPRLERFFSVSGLRAYKAKFQPIWEPRYLVYGSEASLPRIALALVRLTEGRTPIPDEPHRDSPPSAVDGRRRPALAS